MYKMEWMGMNAIINTIYEMPMKFYPEHEYYCFKNCYLQILRYYQVKDSEFYIDCTTEWTFNFDEASSFGYNFGTGEVYSSFIGPYANQVTTKDITQYSTDELWTYNCEAVKQGIPIVVATDVYHLSYTPFFHKKNSFHSLILSGWNENENSWSVVDWYPPWFYRGTIVTNELDNARGSANEGDGILSGHPINYMCAEVSRTGWDKRSKDLISLQIQQQLDSFYTDKQQNIYKGFHAIKQLFSLTEKYLVCNPNQRTEFLEDLYQKCFFVPTRKNLFKWYLEMAAERYGPIKYRMAILMHQETIHAWKGLLSLLIKSAMSFNEQIHEMILKQILLIYEKEKTNYFTLYELSRSVF